MKPIKYEYHRDRDSKLMLSESKSYTVSPHFHHCVEIIYVKEGVIATTVNGISFDAKEDEIIFVHGYATHEFAPNPSYIKYVIVIPPFYSSDFNATLKHTTLNSHLTDTEYNRKILRPLFEIIVKNEKVMPSSVKKGYLYVILGSLFEHYPSTPIKLPGNMDFMIGVLKYIEENYDKPITLDTLSATFGYSKYYFSKLFNRFIGDNINNYINMVRIRSFTEKYKDEEGMRVAELAFSCGFDSLTTFYRYFNKYYKKNPKKFTSD